MVLNPIVTVRKMTLLPSQLNFAKPQSLKFLPIITYTVFA